MQEETGESSRLQGSRWAWRLRRSRATHWSFVIELVIKIVANPIGEKGKNPTALAIAPGSKEARGTVACCSTTASIVSGSFSSSRCRSLLGHVMAHEMGHLLLPYGSHAASVIMKARWDTQQALLASMHSLTSIAAQAALIRTRLRAASMSRDANTRDEVRRRTQTARDGTIGPSPVEPIGELTNHHPAAESAHAPSRTARGAYVRGHT